MNIDKDKIIQIKLVTCQEVLAVIVEKDEETFICSYALELIPMEYEGEYEAENKTYYVLRPYQSYTSDMNTVVSINPFAVVSVCTPSDKVIEQYMNSLETIQEVLGTKEETPSVDAEIEGNVVSFPSNKKLLTED